MNTTRRGFLKGVAVAPVVVAAVPVLGATKTIEIEVVTTAAVEPRLMTVEVTAEVWMGD